ncbi:hypothetical protein QB714_003648 [Salmonella enterica]|nr:hypothetical protein [Salmonella enterica]EKS4717791.1 hypothetical protein [Salmonella enterica]EKS4722564.1 hypothetical protein [Salmonella enterica]EKS4735840.1 hypothetical protein [Salmonella enterica]EKS4772936.1 hypothetical protein [Salmonella enterica]
MTFELISYVGLDVFSFESSRKDIHDILGTPDRNIKSSGRKIIQDVWYEKGLYLFFDSELMREINIRPLIHPDDTIVGDSIKFIFLNYDIFSMPPDHIYSELCKIDGNPIKTAGTTVLLNLGVSLYGFDNYSFNEQDERSFGLFRRGLWDDILNQGAS